MASLSLMAILNGKNMNKKASITVGNPLYKNKNVVVEVDKKAWVKFMNVMLRNHISIADFFSNVVDHIIKVCHEDYMKHQPKDK